MKRITIVCLTLLSALHATAAVAKSITCTYPQDQELTFDVPKKLGGLRRTYFKRCSAERSAHSATYGVQFGYQFGDGAVLGHPHSADTNRPRRRGD